MGGVSQATDFRAQLLKEAQEMRPALLNTCYRITRNSAINEEIIQDLCEKVIRLSTSPDNMRGWLTTCARNAALDWKRAHSTLLELKVGSIESWIKQRNHALDPGNNLTPEREAIAEEDLQEILQAARNLSSALGRKVFTLRKVYGYSQRETAERLRLTELAVAQHLSRAARELAACLGRRLTNYTRKQPAGSPPP